MLILHTTYVMASMLFMILSLSFIGFDSRCKDKRAGWVVFTLLTGPIGLACYLFKGRR